MAPISNGNTMSMTPEQAGFVLNDQDMAEFDRLAAAFEHEAAQERQQQPAAIGEPVTAEDLSSSKDTYAAAQEEIMRQKTAERLYQLRNVGDRLAVFRDRKATK